MGREFSCHFRPQIVAGAQALDYFANLESYRTWVRLVIHNANQSQILLSFHGIGREFREVLACSALFFQRVQMDREERETSPAQVLSRSLFQINFLFGKPNSTGGSNDKKRVIGNNTFI